MIVLFQGNMGSGKTLGMTSLARSSSYDTGGASILSNYGLSPRAFQDHRLLNSGFHLSRLKGSGDFVEFTRSGGGIILLDEVHRLLDSRLSLGYQNIYLSEFFMFIRKIRSVAMLTVQHSSMADVRIRHVLDMVVDCRRTRGGFSYVARDGQSNRPVRTWQVSDAQAASIYGAYDTYELIEGIAFPSTKKAFDKFILDLKAAMPRRGSGAVV